MVYVPATTAYVGAADALTNTVASAHIRHLNCSWTLWSIYPASKTYSCKPRDGDSKLLRNELVVQVCLRVFEASEIPERNRAQAARTGPRLVTWGVSAEDGDMYLDR